MQPFDANYDAAVYEAKKRSLRNAIKQGDLDFVKTLLDSGMDVNAGSADFGITPLMWACAQRRHNIIKALLDRGAAPDIRSHAGRTAADMAAQVSEPDTLQTLVLAGATPPAIDVAREVLLNNIPVTDIKAQNAAEVFIMLADMHLVPPVRALAMIRHNQSRSCAIAATMLEAKILSTLSVDTRKRGHTEI